MQLATLIRRVALVAIAFSVGTSVNAQNIIYAGPDGAPIEGERCATPQISPDQQAAVDAYLDNFLAENPGTLNRDGYFLIPVAYHIIRNDAGTSGDVSDADIEEQTDVLTAAFASMDIVFETSSIDRTDNSTWYTAGPGSAAALAMKAALAIDPASTLNFYTSNPGGGILGWAYFPDSCETCSYHGVVCHYGTLPNGFLFPYNLGDTGTHEVGHFVGLYHTFQDTGGNCTPPGDSVADTNFEADPRFGCPVGAMSCGDLDPIENFMDYTDDLCMFEFTPGQRDRAYVQMAAFRPTMWIKVPVELVSFIATLNGNAATFEWVTSSETNNSGFEVQMLPDGRSEYQLLGFVEGHGTTTEVQHYTYSVVGLNSGTHMFRLKQIDFDGGLEYSQEIEVTVGVPGTHVLEAAYPNPFNPEATFRFGVNTQQNVRAELVDVLGRVVNTLFEGNVAADEMQTVRIDGSGLPSGTYMIRIVGETFVDAQSVTLLK